ncbi:DoxX family membrane protein [Intrasporangium mesophilum]
MSHTTTQAPASTTRDLASPTYQAFLILRSAFTIAPILFGIDKFFDYMVSWDAYLAPGFASLSPFSVHTTMYIVGVVEIAAGVVVALWPRIGAPIVALWLLGIIVNLLVLGGHLDIALRDLGLCLAAIALARLSIDLDKKSPMDV